MENSIYLLRYNALETSEVHQKKPRPQKADKPSNTPAKPSAARSMPAIFDESPPFQGFQQVAKSPKGRRLLKSCIVDLESKMEANALVPKDDSSTKVSRKEATATSEESIVGNVALLATEQPGAIKSGITCTAPAPIQEAAPAKPEGNPQALFNSI